MIKIDQCMMPHQRRCTFGVWTALVCFLAAPVRAEVHVEGSPVAIHITTSQDTISDVLSAVAATFNSKYRTAIPLDATANTTYSGSFGQVISRLLDGYNYIIKKDQGTTEIVVFGKRGDVAVPSSVPKAPPVKSIASQWR
jgi:hypothetical protein